MYNKLQVRGEEEKISLFLTRRVIVRMCMPRLFPLSTLMASPFLSRNQLNMLGSFLAFMGTCPTSWHVFQPTGVLSSLFCQLVLQRVTGATRRPVLELRDYLASQSCYPVSPPWFFQPPSWRSLPATSRNTSSHSDF